MTVELTFWLLTPVLAAFICFVLRWLVTVPCLSDDGTIGKGFEPGSVVPRLRKVRADYLAVIRTHPRHAAQHRLTVAVARQAIARQPFFLHTVHEAPPCESAAAHGG